MENRAHALTAGFFALLLVSGLLGALWWFGGGGEEYRFYQLESTRGVTGLNNQAAVRFRGVRVGRVMSIDLDEKDPYKVVVSIRVRQDVPMTHGTHATLASQGLTGNAFIVLDDTGRDSRPLPAANEGGPRIALQTGLVDQIGETGRRVAGRFEEASQNLVRVLDADNIERIDAALKSLAASTQHLEKTLAQAPALMADLRRFASPEAAAEVRQAMSEVSRVSRQLPAVIDNWNRAVGRIEAAGARVDRLGQQLQDGLVADTLPRINLLSGELQGTSAQLNLLVDELQRSPQILLMGREPAAPGPGEEARK